MKFDSNFESGNLEMVREREANNFDVIIRNDSNGTSNVQWFYFRVTTPESKLMGTARLNIVNLTKSVSLFEQV